MKKQILYLLLFWINITVSAQKEDTLKRSSYIGENGQTIIICDSLSFKEDFIPSEFYITAESGLPYTGYLCVEHNGNGLDSSYIFNGKKHGLSKEYRTDRFNNLIIKHIKYYNYGYPKIYASRSFSEKTNFNYSLIYYYDENDNRKNINIWYKKHKIKVKETMNRQNKRYQFKNIEELRKYINNLSINIPIDKYLEMIGAFD